MKTNQPDQAISQDLAEQSRMLTLIGDTGTGKSALAFYIAEEVHQRTPEKRIVALNFPQTKLLPSWISNINDLTQAPPHSLIIADEAAMQFKSRDAMLTKNKQLMDVLPIIRHKDQSLIWITQESVNTDLNIIRKSHFVIMKEMTEAQIETERPLIKKRAAKAQKVLEGKGKQYAYAIIGKHKGLLTTPLPTFWTDAFSTSYSEEQNQPTPQPTITTTYQTIQPTKVASQNFTMEGCKNSYAALRWLFTSQPQFPRYQKIIGSIAIIILANKYLPSPALFILLAGFGLTAAAGWINQIFPKKVAVE